MNYFGPVRERNGKLELPDGFPRLPEGQTYDAVQLGADILLVASHSDDPARSAYVMRLAERSMQRHRAAYEGLAR